jgi:hypothetical protein
MATYDGALIAYRIKVKKEGIMMPSEGEGGGVNLNTEAYYLFPIKKWDFSGLILSLVSFGVYI